MVKRFSDLGITSDVVVGKGIEIEDLFNQKILIEKTIIKPTKFPGKNSSGLRMQMQVCIPFWNKDGNYQRDSFGKPEGDRRSCFTGSDILISAIQQAEDMCMSDLYPLETTIVKVGKCFQFT